MTDCCNVIAGDGKAGRVNAAGPVTKLIPRGQNTLPGYLFAVCRKAHRGTPDCITALRLGGNTKCLNVLRNLYFCVSSTSPNNDYTYN